MAKRYSADQWAAWVREQDESGLSVVDFCDWIGVSQNAFYMWRRKLRDQSPQITLSDCKSSSPASSGFVPLTVLSSAVVEIDLPCGATVRVPDQGDLVNRVFRLLIDTGRDLADCHVGSLTHRADRKGATR